MGEVDDLEDTAEDLEDPAPGPEAKKATEKKERKLYKGEILKVGEVETLLSKEGVLPVQPVTRKFKMHGFEHNLPPSFVVTRFSSGYQGAKVMHFYRPANQAKQFLEIPADTELNVLRGQRAVELKADWDKAVNERLGYIARRITCTIGADPEVFVETKKGVLPAWEFLPGKREPKRFKTNVSGVEYLGTCYWDGFQAEFTTPGELSCLAQVADTMQAGLKNILKAARVKDKKAVLSLSSVVKVEDDVLRAAAPEHVAFGCAPSLNIYGLKGNGQEGRDVPYRFAGGHIHFGLGGYSKDKLAQIVRSLDSVLAVAAVSMFAKYDNPVRRQFYGQPGEHRFPAHGLEYRVLSNAWLSHPVIYHMVFDLARAAAGLVDEGLDTLWKATEKETVETVMNHDVTQARAILRRNEGLFRGILQMAGGIYLMQAKALDVAWKVWTEGMETAIAAPEDIETNWCLSTTWTGHSEGANAQFCRAWEKLSKGQKL